MFGYLKNYCMCNWRGWEFIEAVFQRYFSQLQRRHDFSHQEQRWAWVGEEEGSTKSGPSLRQSISQCSIFLSVECGFCSDTQPFYCLHTAKEALQELQLLTSPQLNRSQRSYFEKWISTKNNETNNEWTNEWATHKINSWKDEYSGILWRGLVGNYISLDKTIINTLRQKMRAKNSGTPSINNLRAVLELYIWTLTKIPIRLRCARRHDIGEKLTALRTSRDSALRASDT